MSSAATTPVLTAYMVLARNLPDTTVVMYDSDLQVLLAEGSDLPVLGFGHRRIVGFSLFDTLPADVAARYEPHLLKALLGERSTVHEVFGEGRSIYQIQFGPARHHDGSIFAGMILCQNVTAQRSAESKLRDSEGRYRALIRAVPDTLLLLDANGTVLEVFQNPRTSQITGVLPLIRGVNIRDIQLPQVVTRLVFNLIERALASEQLETAEADLTGSPGQALHAELRCVPLSDAQVMLVVRDVTELRKAQHSLEVRLDELTGLHARLSELERLKTDMLRLGAHDLRSPLMVIMNYARYLADELAAAPAGSQALQYLNEIVDAAERMKMISRDILDAERIEQMLDTTALDAVEFVSALQSAADGLRANAALKHHTMTMRVPPYPLHGRGDGPMLREAAGNLISNAIKYTPDGGHIEIVVRSTASHVEFSVTDNGYGIPPEAQGTLFEPLLHAGTKEARREAGTGFGLYLVKRIIERHDGEVFFESRLSQGSTFGFRLPISRG